MDKSATELANQGEIAMRVAIQKVVRFVKKQHNPHLLVCRQSSDDTARYLIDQSAFPLKNPPRLLGNRAFSMEFVVDAPPECGNHRVVVL